MGRVLVIGDTHLKVSNLEVGKRFLGWIRDIAVKYRPDVVVNLGDFFDAHAVLRAEVVGEYARHVGDICGVDSKPAYVHVLGNHEFYKPNSSEYHALQGLRGLHNNYHVADTDGAVKIGKYSFIPYHVDPATFPKQTNEICFAHQTFIGADFGQYRPEVGVDMDDVSAQLIISGHIHKGQQIGKVIYPGSPFARGVDDVDQIKGVYLFDDQTYAMTFIESPFSRWRSYAVESSQQLNIAQIHAELQSVLTPGDTWILKLEGPKAELGAYLDSSDFKALQEQFTVQVRAKYTDSRKERTQIRAVTVHDAICQYVDLIYGGDIDKDLLKKRALEMMGEKID